jgi:fluoride exporter
MPRGASRPRRLPPSGMVAVVGVGGAIGTAIRYGLGQRFPVDTGSFPVITLCENIAGAALFGLLLTALVARELALWWRLLLTTGVLGSFTTFSTFATEVVLLVDGGETGTALTYTAATAVLGIGAAAAGIRLGHRRMPGDRADA